MIPRDVIRYALLRQLGGCVWVVAGVALYVLVSLGAG